MKNMDGVVETLINAVAPHPSSEAPPTTTTDVPTTPGDLIRVLSGPESQTDASSPYISNTGSGALSWNHGDNFAGPGGLHGDPASAAGVGASPAKASPAKASPASSSLALESRSGRLQNTSEILGGR